MAFAIFVVRNSFVEAYLCRLNLASLNIHPFHIASARAGGGTGLQRVYSSRARSS